MKKAVLIVSALLLVISGVAAVSAFEGHLVDIKAHVENAIGVDTYELDFGAVFPQEDYETELWFGLSNSFNSTEQTRLSTVKYELYWELKPAGDHNPEPLYLGAYFQPILPFIVVEDPEGDPGLTFNDVYDPPPYNIPTPTAAVYFGKGELYKLLGGPGGDLCDAIRIKFYVPVFEGYHNELTDPKKDYPYMLMKDQYVTVNETICDKFEAEVPHADLGINLKIQVVGFIPHVE